MSLTIQLNQVCGMLQYYFWSKIERPSSSFFYELILQCLDLWIFPEIDKPLDFIENMRTNVVLNVVSYNDVRFLRKLLFKTLFSFSFKVDT